MDADFTDYTDKMEYTVEDHILEVLEPPGDYESAELNALTYKVIGAAMEIHTVLGKGFSEAVYNDCLKIELAGKQIQFQNEKKYEIFYKGIRIPHFYYADFLVENKVILEIKAQGSLVEGNVKQLLNYLAISKCKIGLLINFGEDSLQYKRVILTKK